MKPPKCKSCGAEEWRHVCGGRVKIAVGSGGNRVISGTRTKEPDDRGAEKAISGVSPLPVPFRPQASGDLKQGVNGTPIVHKPEIATGAQSRGEQCSKPSTSSGSKTRQALKMNAIGEPSKSLESQTSSTEVGTTEPAVKSSKATRSSSPKARKTKRQASTATMTAPTSKPSKATFDRNAYQAEYMRDLPKARAFGMKVAEWRKAGKPI